MKHNEKIAQAVAFVDAVTAEVSASFTGKTVMIQQSLSFGPKGSFDRHHTNFTNFHFIMESVSYRISGMQLTFWGQNQEALDIDPLRLVDYQISSNAIWLIQQIAPNVQQKTTIKLK